MQWGLALTSLRRAPIATPNFTGLVMATRYCYRTITTSALGDGDPKH
jgi:hypothetical protein